MEEKTKDWTGNRNSTFVMLGASNHTNKQREVNDFYATDPHALEIFLDKLEQDNIKLHRNIWECACGQGHLSEVLKKRGYEVRSTDVIDRGYGDKQIDFLKDKYYNEFYFDYIDGVKTKINILESLNYWY